MSAEDYVIGLLHKKLGVKSVTVGTDFNFGKGGAYTIEDLKRIGAGVSMQAQAIDGVELDGARGARLGAPVDLRGHCHGDGM